MGKLLQLVHAVERADDALFPGFLKDIAEDYGATLQVLITSRIVLRVQLKRSGLSLQTPSPSFTLWEYTLVVDTLTLPFRRSRSSTRGVRSPRQQLVYTWCGS